MRDLTIDFSSIRFNLKDISEERILSQYRGGKYFKLLLGVFTSEIQELLDAIADLIEYRSLQKATGESLDAIGRIVGQPREGYDYEVDYWFKPNEDNVQPDNGHWWSNPAEQAIYQQMTDNTYRQRIWLKILDNHNLFSAKTELENIIVEGLSEKVGIERSGNMQGKILCDSAISLTNYNILGYNKNNTEIENYFMLPYSATTNISEIERR